MNTFLDVGALQIQTYLTRGYRLRGRARGSRQVAEVSARYRSGADDTVLRELLGAGAPAGWEFNPDAGAVDGVVSLRRPGTADETELREVAGRVLQRLREHWPGAHLHAAGGAGEHYVDAYRDEIGPKLSRHEVWFSLPAADELPVARPCQLCEQDASVERHPVVEDTLELCPDCLSRGVHASQGGEGARAILLEQLAAAGNSNHLGTVFMDGNAVGALFAGLVDREHREQLSQALPEATGRALDAATRAVCDGRELTSTDRLLHVRGGDDVLVSLSANRVWRFTRELLASFEQEMAARVGRMLGVGDADPDRAASQLGRATAGMVTSLPSAAAGVVVAHYLTPMATCIRAAQERLDTAKRAAAGRSSTVAWTDLTVDGPVPPRWRRAWRLPELEQASPSLARLAGLPQSARHAAARLVDPDRPEVSWCRLATHLARFDSSDPTRAALEPLHAVVREADDPALGMDRLLDSITLARWW